jgi:hypothetical protein
MPAERRRLALEADQNDQLDVLSLEEQVTREVDLAFVRHGYVLGDGQPDKHAVEDKVYSLVSAAVVEKRPDRGKVAITKRRLMSSVFGQVPGPEAWIEQEDAELARDVYKRLDGQLWRLVTPDAAGKIQKRLNSDIGLILCKTKATPDEVEAVYVTKDLNCLLADFSTPQRDKLKKEADRFATNLAMAIERLPVHASRFKNELNGGMKTALGSASAILQPALEAAAADRSEGDDGDE